MRISRKDHTRAGRTWTGDRLEMWITLITFILHLICMTLAAASSLGFCYKKKSGKSLPEKGATLKAPSTPVGEIAAKAEMAKEASSSERTDSGAALGADNPQVMAVLAEPPGDEVSEGYVDKLEFILETAGTFMWGMKKHMAADEAAWRELAKRITLLRAEGYDVRAGTKEAKLRRLTSTQQTSLMDKVTRKKRRRADAAVDAD
ncbi:hypothetical protein GCK32_005078 [Trichostrongylus colubriformis]|uniref:Uncharacterized protein n=1 Tax=Trichostrongylus colubriformis TaxID=6319 RepID=A0AAN8FT36_TRICO